MRHALAAAPWMRMERLMSSEEGNVWCEVGKGALMRGLAGQIEGLYLTSATSEQHGPQLKSIEVS